jgi:hypothetical protein
LLAVVCGLLVWGMMSCGRAVLHGRKQAIAAVNRFHELLDAENYPQLYQEFDPAYREAITPEKHKAILSKLHNKFGSSKSTENTFVNVNANTSGTFVNATFRTVYANGVVTETFTWRKRGEQLRLVNFNIESPLLLDDK